MLPCGEVHTVQHTGQGKASFPLRVPLLCPGHDGLHCLLKCSWPFLIRVVRSTGARALGICRIGKEFACGQHHGWSRGSRGIYFLLQVLPFRWPGVRHQSCLDRMVWLVAPRLVQWEKNHTLTAHFSLHFSTDQLQFTVEGRFKYSKVCGPSPGFHLCFKKIY